MDFLSLLAGILVLLSKYVELFRINYPTRSPLYYGRLGVIYPDEGEPVSIKFVTRIRHRRDVSNKDYHIVRLNIPSRDETFDVHLTRDDNIDQLTQTSGEEENSQQGLFTGTIFNSKYSKNNHGSSASNNSLDFSVAVSLLTYEDGGVEVNGHLILGQEHFVIEPSTAAEVLAEAKELGETQHPHRIFNVHKLIKKGDVTFSDALHVPPDELEKAYKEMENSTNTLNDTLDAENNGETDTKQSSTLPFGDDSDQNDVLPLGIFVNNAKPQTNKKAKAVASKESSASEKVVEIAVFTDAKLYKIWHERYPTETKGRMKNFILNLINNMNLLYHHASLGVTLSFSLVYLDIQTTKPDSINENSGDGTLYLRSFCKYAGDKNAEGNKWDHALLLTGYDIYKGNNTRAMGMAYVSTMCLRYLSCSISEGFDFTTTYIITHEVGHSLGMQHDGTGISSTCDKDKYIMSTSTGSGKVTWSTCSSQNIKEFIKSGNPDLTKKDVASIPKCLTRSSPLKNQKINFVSKKLPGQVYSTKVQCQLDCGNNCVPNPIQSGVPNRNTDICNFLWCDMFFEKDGQQMLQSKGAHPALEGTPCGTGKHCRYGKCIKIKSR